MTRLPRNVARQLKIARVLGAEKMGSTRYSRPALNSLDTQMLRYLPPHGTFLEIGANDGYSQSNTYYLERVLGWKGVLIEPNPALARIAGRLRVRSECFNYACVEDASIERVTLSLGANDLMAVSLGQQSPSRERQRLTDGPTVSVPATTLSHLVDLSALTGITFMSVDVEGSEMSVLGGLEWERHTPKFLLVETDFPDLVDDLVDDHMTRVAQLSFHDYLWTSK